MNSSKFIIEVDPKAVPCLFCYLLALLPPLLACASKLWGLYGVIPCDQEITVLFMKFTFLKRLFISYGSGTAKICIVKIVNPNFRFSKPQTRRYKGVQFYELPGITLILLECKYIDYCRMFFCRINAIPGTIIILVAYHEGDCSLVNWRIRSLKYF